VVPRFLLSVILVPQFRIRLSFAQGFEDDPISFISPTQALTRPVIGEQ